MFKEIKMLKGNTFLDIKVTLNQHAFTVASRDTLLTHVILEPIVLQKDTMFGLRKERSMKDPKQFGFLMNLNLFIFRSAWKPPLIFGIMIVGVPSI